METAGRGGGASGFFRSRANQALIGFLAIASFFLVTEHRAHLIPYLQYLPFALFFVLPSLHVYMHGDDAGHDGERMDDARNPPRSH